jgi:hypothetical protein
MHACLYRDQQIEIRRVGRMSALLKINTRTAGVLDRGRHLSPQVASRDRAGRTLPPYEDIVLGSLGRLTDRPIVVEGQSPQTFKVLRCRRGIHDWLGADAEHKPIGRLPKEFPDRCARRSSARLL